MEKQDPSQSLVTIDSWHALRQLTPARIALGRAGGSLPTHELLDFQLAHARARDAVHEPFDVEQLAHSIETLKSPTLVVESAAPDRATFLRRPDLGRVLSEDSRPRVKALVEQQTIELVITVSDGLSALAVHRQVVPLLNILLPQLQTANFSMGPIILVRFGRVAIQDDIGLLLNARLALMLIGERPGLGASDSLGTYLVYDPKPGRTDADRNCVSNIRPEGLTYAAAAQTITHLLTESRRRQISGVQLKND